MSDEVSSIPASYLSRLHRFSQLLDKSDCDLPSVLSDLESDLTSVPPVQLHLLINRYLPIYVKSLLDRRYIHFYLNQMRICAFFKTTIKVVLTHLSPETPGALDVIRRLLNDEKEFYNAKYTNVTSETAASLIDGMERDKEQADQEVVSVYPEFAQVKTTSTVNIFYPYILNFFGISGGFVNFQHLISSRPPLEQLNRIFLILTQVHIYLLPKVWRLIVESYLEAAVAYVLQASDEDLRGFSKENLRMLTGYLDTLEADVRLSEHGTYIERFELSSGLKFLLSPYLDKRILGLTTIIHVIERAEKQEDSLTKTQTRRIAITPVQTNIEMTTFHLKPTFQHRYMHPTDLLTWCNQHDLIRIIFGEKSHSELVRRSGVVVKFLYKQGKLNREGLERIWTLAMSKHEVEKDVTVAVYREIIPVLNVSDAEYFFTLISAIPLNQVDTQVLNLIVAFSKPVSSGNKSTKSIKISIPETEVSPELSQNQMADPGKPIALGYYPGDMQRGEAETEPEGEIQCLEPLTEAVLELLWTWSQPQSVGQGGLKREIGLEAMKQLQEILRTNAKQERWKYMEKCVMGVRENLYPVGMCQILQSIVSSYGSYRGASYGEETRAQVISRLDQECNLFTLLYNNIVWIKRESAHRLMSIMQSEGILECDQRTDTQSSSSADSTEVEHYAEAVLTLHLDPEFDWTYYQSLHSRLDFLKFLYQNSELSLNIRHFNLLWSCFAVNAFSQKEQDEFFTFVAGLLPVWSAEYSVLEDDTIHTIFTDILLRLESKTLTFAAFECFEHFFLYVNKVHGLLEKLEFDDELEVKDIGLLGIEALWEHILTVQSEKVSSSAGRLLKRLYRGVNTLDSGVQTDLLVRCMYQVKVGTERIRETGEGEGVVRVSRALSILSELVDEFEGVNDSGPSVHLTLQNTTQHCKEPKLQSLKLPLRMKLSEAREIIASKLIPPKSPNEILILHSGNNLDSRKNHRSLKELKLADGHKLIICDSVDQYGYISVQTQVDDSPLDSTKTQQVEQLKAIFEQKEEILVAALKRANWVLEDAAELMTNEEVMAELEKELKNVSQPPPPLNPSRISHLLSDNREHFDLLFQLLSIGNSSLSAKVWKLLTQIPINKDLYAELKEFSEGWEDLLDANSRYKLLYSLKIIISILNSSEIDDFREKWHKKFIKNGGFARLYEIFLQIDPVSLFSNEQKLNNAKFTGFLLTVIQIFVKFAIENPSKSIENSIISYINWDKMTTKLLDLIENLSENEVETEILSVIESCLSLFLPVILHQPEMLRKFYERREIIGIIRKMLIGTTEKQVKKAFIEMILTVSREIKGDLERNLEPPAGFFLRILLDSIPKETNSGTDFFDLAAELVKLQHFSDLNLVMELIKFVSEREIMENRRLKNQDTALSGVLTLIEALLEENPLLVEECEELCDLLYGSLFDMPGISEMDRGDVPPKFKHEDTRRRGFGLMLCVVRLDGEKGKEVLRRLHQVHCTADYHSIYDSAIPIKSSTGFVGLKNLGSTCYMNSLLQQLYLMTDLRSGILQADLTSVDNLEDNVLYQLQLIFANLQLSEKQYFPPRGLVNALRDMEGQALNPSIQQDVDEFFSLLCDRLENVMKGTKQEKLLRNLMGGTVVNIIESTEIEFPYTSEREEQFLRISLEIKNKKTLEEALNLYIQKDVLDGDNQYFCDLYSRKVTATRHVLLDSLSNTVLIHLKRFEFDYTTSQRVKINDYCEFPMELNLKQWTKDGNRGESYYEYQLAGVLVHTGIAEAGHYFSFAMDRHSGKWYEFNDQVVKEFHPESIKEECFGGMGSTKTYWGYQSYIRSGNAYLLVYERRQKLPISEEIPENSTVFNLEKDIINAVTRDNIDFLRDAQFFDQNYHKFLLNFTRQYRFIEDFSYFPYYSFQSDRYVVHWEEEIEEIEEIESNFEVKLVQTAFFYALELLLRAKLTDFFKEWLQLIMNLVKLHTGAAFWLLKKLTPSSENISVLSSVLFEERQSECRVLFSELLVQLVLQTLSREGEVFGSTVKVRVVKGSGAGKYGDEYRYKAATARLLGVMFGEMMGYARRNWRRFREYFKCVFQLLTSTPLILRFAQSVDLTSKLLEFYMNGSSPFVLDDRLIMGDHVDSPDMELPVEIFVLLVTHSATTEMREKSLFPSSVNSDIMPLAGLTERYFLDYRVLRAFLTHYRPEPIQRLITHVAFANRNFSAFAIEELLTMLNASRIKWAHIAHILRYVTSLLGVADMYEDDRVRFLLSTPMSRSSSQYLSNTLLEILHRFKDTCEMFTVIVLVWFGDMLGKERFRTVAEGFKVQFAWIGEYVKYFDVRNLSQTTIEDYRGVTVHLPTALKRVAEVVEGFQVREKEQESSSEGTDEDGIA